MKASKYDISLIQCYKCSGYFNEDRIDAHSRICVGIPDDIPTKKPLLPSFTFDTEEDETSTDIFSIKLEKDLKIREWTSSIGLNSNNFDNFDW